MKFMPHLFLGSALGLGCVSNLEAAQPGVDLTMPTDSPVPASLESSDSQEEINDPLEPLNRLFFGINRAIDTVILKPLAVIYTTILPTPVQNGVGNFIQNLASPIYFVNHILQGNAELAAVTMLRAVVNTTMGIGGFVDVGREMGLEGVPTGFSDTLGVWGVDTGPYLMLPILGPHTFRGATGFVGDYYTNLPSYYFKQKHHHKHRWMQYSLTGLETIHNRSQVIESLNELEKSENYYELIRSIHLQQTKNKINRLKALKNKSYEGNKTETAFKGESYSSKSESPVGNLVTDSPKP